MIKIIAFGEFKNEELLNVFEDYLKRIKKYHKIETVILKEETKKSDQENLTLEKDKLLTYLKGEYIIALDRQGDTIDSLAFSSLINNKLSSESNITFIIGSSNGLHLDIINKADKVISFSNLTFPHLIFRVMLVEQIYRSFKIIKNESYHK